MNQEFKKLLNGLKIVALGLILGVGVATVLAQSGWQGPSAPPFGGNTPRPINIGPADQEKTGQLKVQNFFFADVLTSYTDVFVSRDIFIGGGQPANGKILSAVNDRGKAEWVNRPVLSCVQRAGDPSSGEASCQNGEVMTGGGGGCSTGQVKYSGPSPGPGEQNTWELECADGGIPTFYAICCRLNY